MLQKIAPKSWTAKIRMIKRHREALSESVTGKSLSMLDTAFWVPFRRCGSQRHSLSRCKKPSNVDDPFPFASCFVCNGKGHLASSCPQNKGKGIYPNGGCCKLCGETTHLARNCTMRQKGAGILPFFPVFHLSDQIQSKRFHTGYRYRTWGRRRRRRLPYLQTNDNRARSRRETNRKC